MYAINIIGFKKRIHNRQPFILYGTIIYKWVIKKSINAQGHHSVIKCICHPLLIGTNDLKKKNVNTLY